jgi:hypothetical protein
MPLAISLIVFGAYKIHVDQLMTYTQAKI